MLGHVIDIVLAAIIALTSWRGYKNGIIRGVCGLIAMIVAIYGAHLISTAYSGEFTGMLRPFVGGIVDSALSGVGSENNTDELTSSGSDVKENEEIPSGAVAISFSALQKIGLPVSAARAVSGKLSDNIGDMGRGLSAGITNALCESLAYIGVFGIAFAILTIVFAVIGNVLNLVFKLPGIERIDSLIGIIFGFSKGIIIIFVIALVVRYVGLLSSETVENTKFLYFLVNHNPIADILSV